MSKKLHCSLTSRVLDALGRRLIGPPEQLLGEGYEDFYFIPGDRQIIPMGDRKLERERIAANVFRRLLFQRVATLASILSLVMCAAGLLLHSSLVGINSLLRASTSAVGQAPTKSVECERLRGQVESGLAGEDAVNRYRAACVRQ